MSNTSTTVLEDIQDTYISVSNPDINFFSSSLLNLASGSNVLFDIPISFVRKSSKIHSCTLNLHVANSTSALSGKIYLLDGDILINEATWNSSRIDTLWNTAGGDISVNAPVLPFVAATYPSIVSSDSPLGYWRLGESSGTTAIDQIGAANGTYASCTLGQLGAIAGDADTAVLFNGTTSRFSASPAISTGNAAYTMEVWAKFSLTIVTMLAYGVNTPGQYNVLGTTSFGGFQTIFANWGTSSLIGKLPKTSIGGIYSSDGKFHHFVSTYDLYARSIYVDNYLVAQDFPNTLNPTPNFSASNFGSGNIASNLYYNGTLDEVAFYNKALTKTEIQNHYNIGSSQNVQIDITEIANYVVSNGLQRLKLVLVPDTVIGTGIVQFDSAGSPTRSYRPSISISYDVTGLQTTDQYPRVLGEWVSSTEDTRKFTSSYGHIALGTGTTTEDPASLTSLVSETENYSGGKGYSVSESGIKGHFTGKTTNSVTIKELGLYRKDGTQIQNTDMDDITPLSGSYKREVVHDVPLSYWRLGEGQGTLFVDYQNLHDATTTSATVGQTSLLSSDTDFSVSLNGTTQFLQLTDNADYNFTNNSPMAVEAWVKPSSISGTRTIFSKQSSDITKGYSLALVSGVPTFSRKDGSTTQSVTSSITAVTSSTYHIVATYDGAIMRIFVNGQEVGTAASNILIPTISTDSYIGIDGSGFNLFAGNIDEVSIYNTALSDTRVAVHYEIGSNSLPSFTKDYTDLTSSKYSIKMSGNALSLTLDPNINGGSISFIDGFLSIDYKTTYSIPASVRIELGYDSSNFFYWDVVTDTMIFDNTWHTLSLNFSDASKFGSPALGYFKYCTITLVYTGVTSTTTTDRGFALDTRGDVEIGKPNFSEISPYSVVSYKLNDPGGVFIDRDRSRMYIVDKGNNRILVYSWTASTTYSNFNPQTAILYVIGQPDYNSSAPNGDGGIQNFPTLPSPTEKTLQLNDAINLSIAELGITSNIAMDSGHNIWVVDSQNNRILRYPYNSAIADTVIGQSSFYTNDINLGAGTSSPSASSLYTSAAFYYDGALADGTASIFVDSNNDIWVGDSGNSRVLRFPSGSTSADLVIGQNSFTVNGTGSGLNQLNTIWGVTLDSTRSHLWISDIGNNRLLMYTAPFTSGMSGVAIYPTYAAGSASDIVYSATGPHITDNRSPNWTTNMFVNRIITTGDGKTGTVASNTDHTITLSSGWTGGTPANGQSYSFDWGETGSSTQGVSSGLAWDTVLTNCFWIVAQSMGAIFLMEATTGNIQMFKGGDLNTAVSASGSLAIDQNNNLISTSRTGNYQRDALLFVRNESPNSPHTLFNAGGIPNLMDQNGLGVSLNGLAIAGSQVVVAEENGRVVFWNNKDAITDGAPADGYLSGFHLATPTSPSSFTTRDTTALPTALCADASGNLWVAINNDGNQAGDGSILRYTYPLTSGQTPAQRIALQGTNGSRSGTLATLEGAAVSYTTGFLTGNDSIWGLACDSTSSELWFSHKLSNRVCRIKNPITSPVVDCVLGQPDAATITSNTGGITAHSLFNPGGLGMDASKNLYVSDHSLEVEGNKRLLLFLRSSLTTAGLGGASTVFAPNADKVFGPNFTTGAQVATWQPAIDPLSGYLVIGYSPYGPAPDSADPIMSGFGIQGRFPGVYTNPLGAQTQPDYYLKDFGSEWLGSVFDSEGNLFVMDHIRNKVVLYRTPFVTANTVRIDNLKLERASTEATLIARGEITQKEVCTTSGFEITDDIRLAATQGDGRSQDSSYGIWVSTTNYCTNGGFESGTTGWTLTDSGTTSVTWGAVNIQHKFGTHCLQLINTASGEDDYAQITISGLTQNTQYTITAWLYAPSVTAGALSNIGMLATDSGGSISTILSTPNTTWERQTLYFTTAVGSTSFNLRLYAPQGTVYWDGVQVEVNAYPTPFILTGGATATRAGSGVKFPSSLINSTQFWIAMQVRINWLNMSSNRFLFDWDSGGNNRISLYMNSAVIDMKRTSGGTTVSAYNVISRMDDIMTIIFKCDASNIYLATNSSAFTAVANTTIPAMTATSFFVGCDSSVANQGNVDVLWLATGTGTLTDADSVTIDGLVDPLIPDFPSASDVTAVWWADDNTYKVPFVKRNDLEYKIDIHNKSVQSEVSY